MNRALVSRQSPYGQMLRYVLMASVVVTIEVGSFWVMNSRIGLKYQVATVVSMAIGIFLNWLGSSSFVFNKSRFRPVHEFILVAGVSLVGVGMQLLTLYLTVEYFNILPVIGKFIAICLTFVWNFLVRKLYIFKNTKDDKDIGPYTV